MAESTRDEPILRITPWTLEFPVVLSQSITTNLRLENTTNGNVAFKIKTTAPKNYLVRPSTGVVAGKQYLEVQIILQPLTSEPAEEPGDRFLVQATPTEESVTPSREFWTSVAKADLFDQRLNVKFKKESGAESEFNRGGGLANFTTMPPEGELQAKYKELVKLATELQEEKLQMQNDMENLRQRLMHAMQEAARNARSDGTDRAKGGMLPLGFELWHAIPAALMALIALKLLGYI